MRILSKFKDYYDHACPYLDTDKARTYARKPRLVAEDHPLKIPEAIGFCGKIYPITNYYGDFINLDNPAGKPVDFCWAISPSMIKSFKRDFIKFKEPVYWNFTERLDLSKINNFYLKDNFIELRKYMNHFNKQITHDHSPLIRDQFVFKSDEITSLFKKFNSPILYFARGGKVYADILLESCLFYRLFPPKLAYQEIDMYLPLLKETDEPSPQTNNGKIVSKGFDKFSFRKRPESK